MGRSPSRSYWSGMRLLQLRQVKCHPFIPLKSLSLVVFSSSTISEPDSRNTRERAREEQESILIFSPEGEGNASQRVRPLRRLQLVRLEFPRNVHLVSLSRVVVRSLARSLSIGATVFWQTLTVRARSGVGDAHAELLMLPKMSVTYDRRGLEIHYQFRSD